MFSEITPIDILFKFTVFSLLLIKILQLLKNYVAPYLFDEIKREKAIRIELIEKENFVKSTKNKIENQIRNQNKLFIDLEKNVQKWNSFLKNEDEETGKKIAEIKVKIEQKRNIQRKNYFLTTAYSKAIPQAVDLAQKELEILYTNNDSEGRIALNKLIESMSKI